MSFGPKFYYNIAVLRSFEFEFVRFLCDRNLRSQILHWMDEPKASLYIFFTSDVNDYKVCLLAVLYISVRMQIL